MGSLVSNPVPGRDRSPESKDEELPGEVPDMVPEVRDVSEGTDALEGGGTVKRFGGVNIRIMPGTVHGLIGPHGPGKSTLVSRLTPTAGSTTDR
jgi:ABC-type glutathione transport system ATPase component